MEAYLFTLALPAEGTKCAQDQPAFPAPEPAAKALSAKSAQKIVVAPGTRPLRLR